MAKKKTSDKDRKKAVIENSPLAKTLGIKPDEVILGPKRSELIEDGALVDVTEAAKEAGFKVPVALTRAAWDRYVAIPKDDDSGQDEKTRLWDVLWMAVMGASGVTGAKGSREKLTYNVILSANDGKKLASAEEVSLVLTGEGDDDMELAFTISLPGED